MINVFNPNARGGAPLGLLDFRAQLHAALLFTRSLAVPGASATSCPPFRQLWREEGSSVARLLRDGRLTPLLLTSEPSFSAAAEHRIEKASTGADHLDHAELQRFAAELDSTDGDRRLVLRTSVDEHKRAVSVLVADHLPTLVPALRGKAAFIQHALQAELDRSGRVDGTWWGRLAERHDDLRQFNSELRSMGVLVYDTSMALASGTPLRGHAYGRSCAPLLAYVGDAMCDGQSMLAVPEEVPSDERELPPVVSPLLQNVTLEQVLELEDRCRRQKDLFLAACASARVEYTADRLRQVKARLDEYVVALDEAGRVFPEFARRVRAQQRARSTLRLVQLVQGTSRAAAGATLLSPWAAQVIDIEFAGVYAVFFAVVGFGASPYLDRAVKRSQEAVGDAERRVAHARLGAFTSPLR